MRNALVTSLLNHVSNPRFVFLTGDLGYNALEPLQAALGDRFINCGIAEQNMVSVAAGLAREGMRPCVYSIAPFLYARAFEQIRNDVCFHNLPVTLVGNGAGFAYGVNGPTHHSLEDYGILSTLENLHILIPSYERQIDDMVSRIFDRITPRPTWIRLGMGKADHYARFRPFEKLRCGSAATIVSVGDIACSLNDEINGLHTGDTPSLWAVSELPLGDLPEQLLEDIDRSDFLIVVEEHVRHGSIANELLMKVISNGVYPSTFRFHNAVGPPYKTYGSRDYHRKQCGLDAETILKGIYVAPR
jgi:transketolase